jgi:NAD(P)-dependent dehydrogenase (short-subunit alcohol dehydrogenase family)
MPVYRGWGAETMMNTTALVAGSVAVVTGGASGLGLAAATRFCEMGLKVCIADLDPARIDAAVSVIRQAIATPVEVLGLHADVSQVNDVRRLEQEVRKHLGQVNVLMNNAGIGSSSTALGPRENWERLLGVNLWGVINGCQTFLPAMLQQGLPGLIINTGSKQGITTPPGNPAYNVSKAGVKAYTEALQHELRNAPGAAISAHLFIPGFVDSGISGTVRTEKPPGAWTARQTVDFMLQRLAANDFYILCPDNEVDRALDVRRITWAAQDITENRPPLSRWHADYADAFKAFLAAE